MALGPTLERVSSQEVTQDVTEDVTQEPVYPEAKVVSYDHSWPEQFAAWRADLRPVMDEDWLVEHIGSTSVPGLAAKPVIDLAARIPLALSQPGESADAWRDALVEIGWTRPRALGDHEVTMQLQDGVRVAIAHLFTAEQWPTAHLRLFAGWLQHDEQDRDRYAALKLGLVDDGTWGGAYTAGKRAFVEEIVAKARAAAGLNPVVDLG